MAFFYISFGYTFLMGVQNQVKMRLLLIKINLLLFIIVREVSSGITLGPCRVIYLLYQCRPLVWVTALLDHATFCESMGNVFLFVTLL